LLALTATAVPRVQQDIIKKMQMKRGLTVAKKSFDRPNLKITIRRKPITGNPFDALVTDIATAFAKLDNKSYTQAKSTIVYCATKKEVEQICSMISQALAHKIADNSNQNMAFSKAEQIASTFVKPYHAGLSIGQREDAHTNFLIGRCTVIVATVAFGMGIDKPDIRRVIHWGPCKTVEEYYQQIGRAGRDGLSAECTMYAQSLSDFSKFKDSFYIGNLRGEVREATIRSMDALKDFAMSTEGCRRASLLDFFGEKPSFGKQCGTCDLCLEKKQHAGDFERDFQSEGARVILLAVSACPEQSMSTLEKVINGGTVESYRYCSKTADFSSTTARKINSARSLMAKKKPLSYFKELFPPLAQRGFIKESSRQSSHKYAVSSKAIVSFPSVHRYLTCVCRFSTSKETLHSLLIDIKGTSCYDQGRDYFTRTNQCSRVRKD